ncbi:DUF6185 family protein [Streptomyces sp. NPDC090445]|uniref:DUF6185 family protein n=1 Tax=Streptomyces sp. NPDC090445 TaxID=3365963 RepID=UPI0037FD8216
MLLLVCLILSATGTAGAAEAGSADCRADQLKKAKVTALAEFKHRGDDYSKLTSTLDVSVPAEWVRASDLLLDTHSPDYRSALRCLVGKPLSDPDDFRDDEYRFKPVTPSPCCCAWVRPGACSPWALPLQYWRSPPPTTHRWEG